MIGLVERDRLDLAIEGASRRSVVDEARSWLNTPYVLRGRVKGAGCDCFTFIAETMIATKMFRPDDLPVYAGDWFCHITEERYLFMLMRYATKTFEGQAFANSPIEPGNVVSVHAAGVDSRVYNHGAIVTKWPMGIHSIDPCVQEIDLSRDPMWAWQQVKVFDPWRK